MLDLEAAVRLAEDPDLARVVVYHCQQAAEKAIKGFLTWHGVRFGRTHDSTCSARSPVALAPALEAALDRAVELTPYAWLYRYPPDSPAPLEHEAREAIEAARELLDVILVTLPGGLQPAMTATGPRRLAAPSSVNAATKQIADLIRPRG